MAQSATPSDIAGLVAGQSSLKIWSLTPQERISRQFRRAAITADAATARLVVVLRADWIYDDPLVRGLARQELPCVMVTAEGTCVAAVVPPARAEEARALLGTGRAPDGLPRLQPEQVAGAYNDKLRKREPPFLLPLTADRRRDIEARVFAGSYKGVTDFVTLSWARPVSVVTRFCAWLGMTPNGVTSIGFVLALLATWLFWHGHFGWGLLAGWVMAFLDSVDGKLARVTMTYTKFGDVFDHSIDLIHPPFWWWAWIVGLGAAGLELPHADLALWVIIGSYVLQRVEEGVFIRLFGMDMHVWRPFDSRLRLVTARRNPNMAILTVATVFGRPDLGIAAVAWWGAICLLIHAIRIVQATIASRTAPLRSWLS